MTHNYFVIHTDEDGDVYIQGMNHQRLLEELNDPESGYDPKEVHQDVVNSDLQGQTGIYIIEGRLVTPKEVKTVTRWEV